MIPKIIHQTYISEGALPPLFRECQTQVKRLHSDWKYIFHSDEDILSFIDTKYPEYKAAFDSLPRKIMKIDMIRYFWMYEYGGMYIDMDYYMIKPFDILNYEIVLPANREDSKGVPTCLGNCIFASIPKHPFWKSVIDTLFTINRSICLDFSVDSNIDGHSWGTGPAFLFTMWKQWTESLPDLKMATCYGILQPPRRLENHVMHHISSQVRQTEIESGETLPVGECLNPKSTMPILDDKFRHFQLCSLPSELIYVPRRSLFHPPTNQSAMYIQMLKEKGESYGVHKCSGVWRSN